MGVYVVGTQVLWYYDGSVKPKAVHPSFIRKVVSGNNTPNEVMDTKKECLNLDIDGNMATMIANANQIYIIMPAKASGSSAVHFGMHEHKLTR